MSMMLGPCGVSMMNSDMAVPVGMYGDFAMSCLASCITRAQAAQMVVHAADDRPVHADGRGFAAVERLRDLLAERQP